MPDELGEREKEVLRAVVQEYITTGGPVGSQQLTRRGEFEVSSATMRNVLADLEALGFLEKPHTSAGRVPTDRGYRFYVDTLVKLRDPAPRDRELIHAGLVHESNLDDILSEASRVLHSLTRHAGVVLTPRPDAARFQRIEFLRLREDRVLAILVGQNGQVHNKALTVDFPVTSDELVKASNYLSELLHQVPLEEARERIRAEMDQDQALYNALTAKALKLGAAATDLQTSERVLIEGTGSFLEQPEFADVERIRALFRALDEKHKLLHLLDRVQRTKEMHVFIGAESEFSAAGDVTVIASPYGTAEAVLGTVGVIGPTRMDYRRVIPLVNFTAQVLSSVLEKA
ncbi:heat-inducible transcription repressor HrcA [Corallococcus praedator]|uniref:Heat-inducible transcription repressor HrcA n=1 Tax=Corallococcus praedator TaxID=2316724 RepID=A0ABX9Q5G3_9BACT|nr:MULTISPECIES: heat-inducible transcriptional repressor HrcA [Corallococcus]RKH08007.1 heat-inducible transcription repressor HrcA [Corallococcus sp. CA047B]RKH29060.1 heat-inducible transcription repressor HrcA [Corallococcus sp. CA031C]RKH92165.1 heat-inducible transcription repressor HrcA [Corallococcus praedator]